MHHLRRPVEAACARWRLDTARVVSALQAGTGRWPGRCATDGELMAESRIKELRYVRAGDLAPDPRNWRRHPEAQRHALTTMLDRIGYVDAVLVRETPDGLVLVDGHLRAGLDPDAELPALVLDIDEDEAGQVLATLDPLAVMAGVDREALAALTQAMPEPPPMNLAELYNLAPLPTMPAGDPDAIVGPTAEPRTQPGDVWQLGKHRVACGDSERDFHSLFECGGGLVLTDPPYGVSIVQTGRARGLSAPASSAAATGTIGGPGVVQPKHYPPIVGDDRPFDPSWLLTAGDAQIIFGGNHFASRLVDGGAWVVWDKQTAETATFSAFEIAWTSIPGRNRLYKHRWSGMVRAGRRDIELADRIHPTQKPVGMLEQIMADLGRRYDLILDPYLGSGSTLIAAERQGRTCYAMEIDPGYVDMAVARWEKYTGGKAVLDAKEFDNG